MEAETCFQSLHNLKLDLGYENTMRVFGAVLLGRMKCVIHDWDAGPVSVIILFSQLNNLRFSDRPAMQS